MRLQKTVGRLIVGCIALAAWQAGAAIVWSGPDVTFTRPGSAAPGDVDPTLAQNQDRLTDNVWITRGDFQGLINIQQESAYTHDSSPAGTEWADGSAADWQSLTFTDWETWTGDTPPAKIGQPAVLHLIADDIYLDVKFLSWDTGHSATVGGFSYVRSSPVPEPSGLLLIGGAVALCARRRRRSL